MYVCVCVCVCVCEREREREREREGMHETMYYSTGEEFDNVLTSSLNCLPYSTTHLPLSALGRQRIPTGPYHMQQIDHRQGTHPVRLFPALCTALTLPQAEQKTSTKAKKNV